MNDLNTIRRLNAQVMLDNIPALLAKGHYVVVEYAGMHVIGCENFSGEGAADRARAKLAELNSSSNSTHGEMHEPPSDYVGEVKSAEGWDGISNCSHTADHLAQRLGIAG